MKLIILASGRGTRLNQHTAKKPKCLVPVCNKPIISYLSCAFDWFEKVILITGYKSDLIETYLKDKSNVIYLNNSSFLTTNMVESLFLSNRYINDDLIICYSDIIFDLNLLKEIKECKFSTIPIYRNWYSLWTKRMGHKETLLDAENLLIKKKKVVSIGGRIMNEIPKYQFMGIIKLKKDDYKRLHEFYLSLNDKKIDFTSFLDRSIQTNVIDLYHLKTNRKWIEIDNESDLSVAEEVVKSNFLTEHNMQQF